MKTEGGNPSERKITLKEKVTFQLKEFLVMFIYLWLLFALFAIHRSIVLAEVHYSYQAQGFAIVNALILAKVMLIGEDLKLGSRFRHKPLVYSILYKSLVFAVFFICFHIFEEVVVGVFRGGKISLRVCRPLVVEACKE